MHLFLKLCNIIAFDEQGKQFSFNFFIFIFKKEAKFFTHFEELLKVTDFG